MQLEDAIDIREIKNTKLANQFIKLRQTQKIKENKSNNKQNIQAQAQANAEAAEKAAMFEVQKQQALTLKKLVLNKLSLNLKYNVCKQKLK